MPRFEKITAEAERAKLEAMVSRPALLRLATSFNVHRAQDVPGRVCPCCGSEDAWQIGRQDDLEVLISSRRQTRRNGWEIMTPDGRAAFEGKCADARPWGTPGATVWDVPIVYTCGEQQVEQILDDETMVLYWSGGWRSMKSHTLGQWWSRGWTKYGGQGELFWLVGPEMMTAYRFMVRIFYGRGATDRGHQRAPSIFPTYKDPETGEMRSMVAHGLPDKIGRRDMSFSFIDGSVAELRHVMRMAALEGDDVRRIAGDEIVRWRGPDGYRICLGRVTQCQGQFGAASVPDDDGWWVYDEIVGPFQQGTGKSKRVFTMPTRGNLWLSDAAYQRLDEACEDETTRKQKLLGEWTREGMFAYAGHFKRDVHVLDVIGHRPEDWGFEHDVTPQWVRAAFKREATYCGARDFNERPQTGLVGRIFAHDRRDKSTWHLVILDEHIGTGDARWAAKSFAKHFRGGKYAGAGLVCDCNGFWDGHKYGGRASKTTDAFEFESQGFLVRPPLWTPKKRPKGGGKAKGGEPKNPGRSDRKKLVRKKLAEGKILLDSVCVKLAAALPKVVFADTKPGAAGTAADKQIHNFDETLGYLVWVIYSDEQPKPQPGRSKIRGMPRLRG